MPDDYQCIMFKGINEEYNVVDVNYDIEITDKTKQKRVTEQWLTGFQGESNSEIQNKPLE